MKTTKTYSIDESLYSAFDLLTTEKNINKSSFIEDLIKKYLKDNDMDFIDKVYESRFDPTNIVKVLTEDSTYYMLDDGSKIQKILFLHNFKEINGVDPVDFFKKSEISIAHSLAKQIKDISLDKIEDDNFETKIVVKEEQKCYDFRKADDSEKDLHIIEHNFKNKEYLKYDKTKICETIIKLKLMHFELNPTCEILREVLIEAFTNYKDTMVIA
jgi:hypothetical protein